MSPNALDFRQRQLRGTRRFVVIITVGAALALPAATSAQTREPSIAYKLAAIDCKCVPSARAVAQYRTLLTKLVTRKCKETRLKLANEIVRAQNILADDGYGTYKLLRLFRLPDRSIPDRIAFRQPCLDVISALVVLIEK